MATTANIQIDRDRIAELAAREEKQLNAETQGSGRMFERARKVLSSGVASSYQLRDPWPIYLEQRPRRLRLGRRRQQDDRLPQRLRLDGAGARAPGDHKAVTERIELGTHFAAPTEDAVVVAEELQRRWGLPLWRYVTRAPRRRWTRSGSRAPTPAATRS